MKTYTIYTAKTHLSQLIEQACTGEEVVIAKGKNPVVKLVPVISLSHKRAVWCNARQGYGHRSFFRTIAERRISSLGTIIESFAGYAILCFDGWTATSAYH